MKIKNAVIAFSALAHETRLGLLRTLIAAGPRGLNAGELSERAGVSASGLTFHAGNLERAGLVTRRRSGRQVIYAPQIEAVSALMQFLAWNCCDGHPEVCEALMDKAAQGATP